MRHGGLLLNDRQEPGPVAPGGNPRRRTRRDWTRRGVPNRDRDRDDPCCRAAFGPFRPSTAPPARRSGLRHRPALLPGRPYPARTRSCPALPRARHRSLRAVGAGLSRPGALRPRCPRRYLAPALVPFTSAWAGLLLLSVLFGLGLSASQAATKAIVADFAPPGSRGG